MPNKGRKYKKVKCVHCGTEFSIKRGTTCKSCGKGECDKFVDNIKQDNDESTGMEHIQHQLDKY